MRGEFLCRTSSTAWSRCPCSITRGCTGDEGRPAGHVTHPGGTAIQGLKRKVLLIMSIQKQSIILIYCAIFMMVKYLLH